MKQSQMVHAVKQYDTFIENFYLCFVDYYSAHSDRPRETHSNNTRFLHENPEILNELREKKSEIESEYTGRSGYLKLLIDAIKWFIELRDLPEDNPCFRDFDIPGKRITEYDKLAQKWACIEHDLKTVYGIFYRLMFEKKEKVLELEFAGTTYTLSGLRKSNKLSSKITNMGEKVFERIFKTIQPGIVRPEQIDMKKIDLFIQKSCEAYKRIEENDLSIEVRGLRRMVIEQADRLEKLEQEITALKTREMGKTLFYPYGGTLLGAPLMSASSNPRSALFANLQKVPSKDSLASHASSVGRRTPILK